MRSSAFCLIATLALTGCVTVSKSVLTDAYRDRPVLMERVHVYFADDSIPEHTRVAILSAEGDDSMTDRGEMIDRLREEAGKLGANAIVLRDIREPGTGERVVNAIFTGTASGQRRGDAIAIYVPGLDRGGGGRSP